MIRASEEGGGFEFLAARGGIGGEPPAPRWLLTRGSKGVLRRGKTGMLAGEGGIGKSALLCGLALAVATGREWLGVFGVPEPGHVLLAMGEEDEEEMLRRLYHTSRAMDLSGDERRLAEERIAALPLAGKPCNLLAGPEGDQEDSAFLASVKRRAAETGVEWSLVLLDPLSRFAGSGTEASNEAATRFVQATESLSFLPGRPTVLVAHHTTIDGAIVRFPTGRVIDGELEITKDNVGDGRSWGFEIQGRLDLGKGWTLRADTAWLDGKLDTSPGPGEPLVREPLDRLMPWTSHLALGWRGSKWWGEALVTVADDADRLSSRDAGDRQRIPPGGTPAYELLTLRAGWDVSHSLRLAAAVENLFDEAYRVHGSGITAAGRNFVLSAQVSF